MARDAGPPLDDVDPRADKPARSGRNGAKTSAKQTPKKTPKQTPKQILKKTARATPSADGRTRSRRGPLFRLVRVMLGLGVLAAVLGVAGLGALFLYYGNDPTMPRVDKLDDWHPHQVSRVVDRNGVVVGEIGSEHRTLVPYADIPRTLVNAVVAAEDADFFHHEGIDYRGMLRAFIENVLRGRAAQGGSTITQQVVKTMLLSPERTMKRKVQEIILARALSEKLSKEEVLTLYLNQINFGHARYGVEEASRFYFGKSVKAIDLPEAALLAGLPQGPERLSPRKHPDAAKNRQRYVLGRMAELGFIDRATADKVAQQPIRLVKEAEPGLGVAPELTDAVRRLLTDRFGEAKLGGLGTRVELALDATVQTAAREALERGLEELDLRQGLRGPSAHLSGKALDKHRADLRRMHGGGLKESDIVEGLVQSVIPAAGGAVGGGRLVVDVGTGEPGEVDLALEPRYGLLMPVPPPRSGRKADKDKKTEPPVAARPLAERFGPGDAVRVRLAPERPRSPDGHPALALELGPQAAMVVLDPATREVLALVGGYGYRAGGFDRAQRARRQPGSAFKPFVYAAALDSGRFSPASVVTDAPEVYDLWKPQNYEKEQFRGPVRLRTALAHSINTVAIKLLSEVGLPAAREMAVRMGITSPIPDDVGLSLALGAAVVTPLELANAYATIASGGKRAEVVLLRKVGTEVMPAKPAEATVRPEVAYVLTSMMRSVIDEGTAHAAAGKLRMPIAGKTGTSNGLRDAWFVGFTPDLLAAVWVGYDDMHKLGRGEAGGRTALPIWLAFMQKATLGKPVRDFVQPPGVVVARIDKATGLLPAPGAEGIDEVFVEGTVPTAVAPAAGEEQSADKLLLGGGEADTD